MSAAPAESVTRVCAALLDAVAANGDAAAAAAATSADPAVYDGAPRQCSLHSLLRRWVKYAEVAPEVVVSAVAAVDRMCVTTGLPLTRRNVYRVVLSGLIAVTKLNDDRPFTMKHYAEIACVDPCLLRRLEATFLADVDWQVCIPREAVAEYIRSFRKHPQWHAAPARSQGCVVHPVPVAPQRDPDAPRRQPDAPRRQPDADVPRRQPAGAPALPPAPLPAAGSAVWAARDASAAVHARSQQQQRLRGSRGLRG